MAAITLTQYRNALYTLLTDQQTATPTLLRKVYRWRPGGINEKPAAWVGDLNDVLSYDMGTRSREITGEVLIAATYPTDIITSADPFDQLRDALVERFTLNPQVIASTILELLAVSEGDLSLEGADRTNHYRGMTLTTRLRIWEGRE